MKVIFFGTPAFAAYVLEYLFTQKLQIVAIVTQPDRPRGRSQKIVYSEVKETALKCFPNSPLFQPEKASDENFLSQLKKIKADFYVTVSYGQILKQKLLDIPIEATINVHTSLLPKYRGAAPIQRALMNGEKKTGITIMKMDAGLDTGDILSTQEVIIPISMTFGELEKELMEISGPLLLKTLRSFQKKEVIRKPQEDSLSTYAKKLNPQEFEISWKDTAKKNHNLIRSLSPKPGAWCWSFLNNKKKRIKILKTHISDKKGVPGEIFFEKSKLIVACQENSLEIEELQIEGKQKVNASQFLRGLQGSSQSLKWA